MSPTDEGDPSYLPLKISAPRISLDTEFISVHAACSAPQEIAALAVAEVVMPLPRCPEALEDELEQAVARFALAWAASSFRPRPKALVCEQWAKLLSEWVAASDVPLLVRKGGDRGARLKHSISGRELIPCDNSAAHWAFTLAIAGETPSLDEIKTFIENRLIPTAMIISAKQSGVERYVSGLKNEHNVNRQGWKLAHIEAVGLNTRTPIEHIPLDRLQVHTRRLLDPANMFVVPSRWGGLGEAAAVIEAVIQHQELPADRSDVTLL